MSVQLVTRHVDLGDMRTLLEDQHVRKIDVVAPASQFSMRDGNLQIKGVQPILTDEGVTMADGSYKVMNRFDAGLAERLKVPASYLRRLREERVDLYDENVNGLLHGRKPRGLMIGGEWQETRQGFPADERSFLLRTFRGDDGENGIARAFLSDRYAIMDNLDALTAALDGIRKAGVEIKIDGCDLTDDRMYIRVISEEVRAMAPELLKGYRSPFSGETGADNPTVFAGFVISNSETGNGAFSIIPRLVVEVCNNGMTMTRDAATAVHLGSRLEEGLITWSRDTAERQADLITAKARDAVTTFLDPNYLKRTLNRLEEAGGVAVKKVEDTLHHVSSKLAFDEKQRDDVFAMFVKGGDTTSAGVLHAITAAARITENPDKSAQMESVAMEGMALAASFAKSH